ncbi:hypothetical protein G8C93_02995 [Cellulosimicrobium cellulans]|uniref:hypothetical protein n=1 Tax=Cellulosimicrobium cellulans TaxID=1710 RepID=UPI0018846A6F|nr:hypothetical protein [Cellulosimicrobium cellulans]MBE9924858.1 hypothetical protein [Cellulosimicrobium cellulans]
MATDDNEQNPFTRPGFIAAAVVVAIVVVLGIVIAIVNATRSDDPDPTEPSPTSPTTSAAPTPEPSDVAGGASVCGLEGEELAGTLSTAPAANWAYQGTTAYPTSPDFGPGETSADGVRFCFQHSPTGALFMAANALVQGSDPAVSQAWVEYGLADGPHREELLGQVGDTSGSEGTRMSLAGFRMLAYDGDTARVDLAVRASSEGQNLTLSGVYELVWQDGDWKISADVAQPLNTATVPDLAGYITWGE